MPQAMAPEWPRLTAARLAERDGGPRCWHCGVEAAIGVQHRGVKGMGGSPDAERPSNGIVLCNALNVAVEQDADVAAWSEAYGWKVSKWVDPATVPVYDAMTGYWWLLLDDWTRVRVA